MISVMEDEDFVLGSVSVIVATLLSSSGLLSYLIIRGATSPDPLGIFETVAITIAIALLVWGLPNFVFSVEKWPWFWVMLGVFGGLELEVIFTTAIGGGIVAYLSSSAFFVNSFFDLLLSSFTGFIAFVGVKHLLS